MRSVLAAIEPDPCARPVLGTAIALADLFNATPVALHVREHRASSPLPASAAPGVALREVVGNVTDEIAAAAADPDVAALVLGARGLHGGPQPAGHTALHVITRVVKPVAVVPPQARTSPRFNRILVPLEGTIESSRALEQTFKLAHEHQLEILVLHVYLPTTVPAFSDHEPHGTQVWEQEFLARYLTTAHGRLEVVRRLGVPADDVVAVAHEALADMLVLAWSQKLSPGRARVVSQTLAHSDIPVLLISAL